MNYFKYKLISSTGELLSGIVKLPYRDVISAISHLERDGGITIYVKKRTQLLGKLVSFRLRKKLSRSSQTEILSNISLMLRSGVPLTTALVETAVSTEVSEVARNFNDMIISIQGGATFSEAADKYRHIFPKSVIYIIRIGE